MLQKRKEQQEQLCADAQEQLWIASRWQVICRCMNILQKMYAVYRLDSKPIEPVIDRIWC